MGKRIRRKALFFHAFALDALRHLGCADAETGIVTDDAGAASISRVYVAGDVSRDVPLAIIAAAEGAPGGPCDQ